MFLEFQDGPSLGLEQLPLEGEARKAQSMKRWQAFFQRQAVHHMSLFSIP